ncbi:bifunctional DNA-binding transcriptional regulator/antitoxin component of YhaV-PrlF toxin-antitoxin module [Virgibacillus natechei]|uniref:Bifunctional DNA-binding transcriptional regulator/antitoxin component of YhaV-PrlF toxin-antitoxin module n=1 Tax=Virgibacillus natechei TaxID=1216297 RepID=A0ABS4IH96_9BACI|nr:AbrB/MazE/SpoVT family DNA-binding domain-containing protein [Virgibacillus natechei]MBP1970324.1 bifunctional DNA-binding transcriptional regulator/antitoxin component of YhaV-PrlF toxin-antitoxin module [Virgibacillus natechei]UZD13151.1 AbrB/MazE/SpoVT family DNA-binding domain-containing protein [Virgibacillus natechei]
MVVTIPKERVDMADIHGKPVRRVKVSKQRQISIPRDFYDALDLDDEAIVEYTGKEIVIRPAVFEDVDFSEDILKDLVKQGYSGDELIEEFSRIKSKIPKAMDYMKREAMEQPIVAESLDDYLDALEDGEENE